MRSSTDSLAASVRSDLYTARERAALAFTEEVTRIGGGGVSDAVWQRVVQQFSEVEHVRLLTAICAINTWNRMAVATHQELPERTTT